MSDIDLSRLGVDPSKLSETERQELLGEYITRFGVDTGFDDVPTPEPPAWLFDLPEEPEPALAFHETSGPAVTATPEREVEQVNAEEAPATPAKTATAKRAAPKNSKYATFTPNGPTPLIRTASVVLSFLRFTRQQSLSDIERRLIAGDTATRAALDFAVFSPKQIEDMARFWKHLLLLRVGPTVSIAECPECGKTMAVAGTAPKTCKLTGGCTGTLVKAGFGTKVPYIFPEWEEAAE